MQNLELEDSLKSGDPVADKNRARFDARGVFAVNLVGPPGSGKTTLLEALIRDHHAALAPCVIMNDARGRTDADRIAALGVPMARVAAEETRHLDASLIASAIDYEFPSTDATLLIENDVEWTAAGSDLGEHIRLAVWSVPAGSDELAKPAPALRRCQILAISQVDLLGECKFDLQRVRHAMTRYAPTATVAPVSAVTGEGVTELAAKILSLRWA